MKPLKEKVSITLDAEIIAKIKEMAEEDDRNFSQYINMVLRDWIRKNDPNNTMSITSPPAHPHPS